MLFLDTSLKLYLFLGYIQPVKCDVGSGLTSYLTDGGLVCNFPIHVFDGTYIMQFIYLFYE